MNDRDRKLAMKRVDTGEFELPETLYVRDIENKVFQTIVLQCLAKIEGIGLAGGNFIDNLLGREGPEGIRGISVEQNSQKHCVSVKVEANIRYGLSIPEKSDEIQTKISEEVTRLTGLHVSCVHIIFKNILPETDDKEPKSDKLNTSGKKPAHAEETAADDYSDEF